MSEQDKANRLLNIALDAGEHASGLAEANHALRLALAASEAREMALREALGKLLPYALEDVPNDDPDDPDAFYTTTPENRQAMRLSKVALSAPRDSEALRAMLEAAWECGWQAEELDSVHADERRDREVARILSGGADE